jgi:tRNA pseudouridine55 synthase
MNGVIIVDKPSGWTSHDVVSRMRSILRERSIGHLGTLDPLATGVLPLVTGSLTRLAQFYISSEKTYEGVIRFGFATNTYDADGDPIDLHAETADASARSENTRDRPTLNLDALQALAARFLGHIEQIPPPFSAKKINGVPAYKLARNQKEVTLKPVQIEIKEFSIIWIEADRAHFRARVSSGTYMRSIAHEMGQLLGCGAHLESLRRTSVAEFDISQSHTVEEIEGNSNPVGHACPPLTARAEADRTSLFIHPRQLLPHLPSVTADEPTVARIRSGRPVNLPDVSRSSQIKVFANQSELLAIATRIAGTLFHPRIVFPTITN